MTDENKFDVQSRRKFLKTTGAVGAAATTGVAAFGGQAAAQETQLNIDASDIDTGDILVLNIEALNIDVEDINISDITVKVQNINVEVLTFEETTIDGDQVGLINVKVTDSLNNVLRNATVNVLVQILSETEKFVGRDTV